MSDPARTPLRQVLRDAWRLTAPFFRSEHKRAAWALLLGVVALNLSQVGISVLLNFWRGEMYDSLQHKDFPLFLRLMLLWRYDEDGFMPGFVGIATVFTVIYVYAQYLQQMFQVRWRAWLTDNTVRDWMADRAFYTVALAAAAAPDGSRGPDNPDQRIADDLDRFTDTSVSYGINLVSTFVSLISFSQILWSLSGVITVFGVNVPGYLLYLALFYAVGGTLAAHWVGRPLIGLEFARQRAEANFRFALVRVRENAEGIALYRGDGAEAANLLTRFGAVVTNWYNLIRRRKKLNTLAQSYGQAAVVFPFLIAAPRYFAGAIELGGLMRIVGAFSQVQVASSWFVDNYGTFAEWRATVDRLASFQRALAQVRGLSGAGVQAEPGPAGAYALHGATVSLPGGRTLLDGADITIPAGQSLLLSGPSGAGKSTLFRALAGIWPFGAGRLSRPPGTAMFLPQRAYTPLGTLREAATYPAAPGTIPEDAIQEALSAVGLAALIPELDRDEPWSQRLSGGEQQRLAIARALLTRPDWLFLDEATASLDPAAEAELYALVRRRLPGTTVVSIAHRPELARWHDTTATLAGGRITPDPLPVAAQ